MKEKIYKIVKGTWTVIKEGWADMPTSVKFWNLLLVAALIIVGILSLELLALLMLFGSAIAVAMFFDQADIENHLWIWLMPITWLLILLGIIVGVGIFINERLIQRFNKWLDSKKQ